MAACTRCRSDTCDRRRCRRRCRPCRSSRSLRRGNRCADRCRHPRACSCRRCREARRSGRRPSNPAGSRRRRSSGRWHNHRWPSRLAPIARELLIAAGVDRRIRGRRRRSRSRRRCPTRRRDRRARRSPSCRLRHRTAAAMTIHRRALPPRSARAHDHRPDTTARSIGDSSDMSRPREAKPSNRRRDSTHAQRAMKVQPINEQCVALIADIRLAFRHVERSRLVCAAPTNLRRRETESRRFRPARPIALISVAMRVSWLNAAPTRGHHGRGATHGASAEIQSRAGANPASSFAKPEKVGKQEIRIPRARHERRPRRRARRLTARPCHRTVRWPPPSGCCEYRARRRRRALVDQCRGRMPRARST